MQILRPLAIAMFALSGAAAQAAASPDAFDIYSETAVPALFPAGSIATPERAREALRETASLREQIHETALSKHLACKDGTIFMDYCRGRVRSAVSSREAELDAVEKEARAVIAAESPAVQPVPEKKEPTLSERLEARADAMSRPLPAALSDHSISERWPAGSVTSREKAEAAINDADAAREKLNAAAKAGHDICIGRILVSGCWEDVRKAQFTIGKEIRRVELEAKDFIRAENAAKEKARQAEAKLAAGEAPASSASGLTEERTAAALAEAEKRKADEAAALAASAKREADLENRRIEAEAKKAEAAARAEENRKTREKVAANQAAAAKRAAENPKYEAQAAKRAADAEARRAEAAKNAAEAEKKRAERRAELKAQQEKRAAAQKRYEEEKARRDKSLNPFE